MYNFSTSQKIFIAKVLSKILIFFIGNKKKIIKRDGINYLFYDEKLKEVSNIENFIKKLKKSTQNFFLLHKSFKNKD